MITSNFTLEYTFGQDSKRSATPNMARLPMPVQLQRLNVREEEWASIYDYAAGVVERAVARDDIIKKQLDDMLKDPYSSISFFGNKKRQKEQKEVGNLKAGHDRDTRKGWNTLLDRCTVSLGSYGVSSHLMLVAKTGSVFGVDFRCQSSIQPNKLELRYDTTRCVWTWPRKKIPVELAALHIDAQTWCMIWDKAQSTLTKVQSLEAKKKSIQNKINNADSGISIWGGIEGMSVSKENVSQAIAYAARLVDDKQGVRHEQELEWNKVLDFVEDICYMYGVNVKLMRHENALGLVNCGDRKSVV